MIEIKTVGEDIKVNIEGEGEELLQEFTHLGSAIYNAAYNALGYVIDEGYYNDEAEDGDAEEDCDDCYEYCEIKRGDHFYYRDREFICLEAEETILFAITANCIGEHSFDGNDRNDWRISTLNSWLNGEFLSENFDKKDLISREIDLTADNGDTAYGVTSSYLAPLTVDEYRKYRDIVPLFNEGMWTVTPWHCGTPYASDASYVRFVASSGVLSDCDANSARGLVPACFFDLTILSSRRSARTGRIELYKEGC